MIQQCQVQHILYTLSAETCHIGVIFRQKNIDSSNKRYQRIDDWILDYL